MPENSKQSPKAPNDGTVAPEEMPVTPTENFELGKVDKDRRIFANGDTDRSSDEEQAQK